MEESNIIINTKHSTEKELHQKKLLQDILKTYTCPIFTYVVIIEEGAIPHSHPVLTLNTREDKPQNILKTFVHEQFHWFATLNKNYAQCVDYLKTNYQDLNEGKLPNSHWEHLIVCWNTRNFLKKILTQDEFISVYTDWQAYPLTEKFVEENFDKLKTDLDQWGMVYLG